MIKRFAFMIPTLLFILFLFALSVLHPADAQTPQRFRSVGRFLQPAANTQATISAPAVTNGRNVADCIGGTFVGNGSLAAAATAVLNLRDGATGAGTIVQSWGFSVPLLPGASGSPIYECGLNIFGTTGTALTLEFAAAGGANTLETVSLVSHVE